MIIERFNIFKNKEENKKYVLVLHRPTKGDYLIMMNIPYESSDVISTIDINDMNKNTEYSIKNIARYFNISTAERRLDYVLGKSPDIDWRDRNNWSIITLDDLDLLISTNKFNI